MKLKIKSVSCMGTLIGMILALVVASGLSWLLTCGIIKLITVCFGLTFKWTIATGIWFIILLARTIFKSNS